mgnify:CR=1 FL=1
MKCPKVLLSLELNKKNHKTCIQEASLGPADPEASSTAFWSDKANKWGVSVAAARELICGNCENLLLTPEIVECLKNNPQPKPSEVVKGWADTGDSAGYCNQWDIPCTLSRTCDTWEAGGPIRDEKQDMDE